MVLLHPEIPLHNNAAALASLIQERAEQLNLGVSWEAAGSRPPAY